MENLKIWKAVEKTDLEYTKHVSQRGVMTPETRVISAAMYELARTVESADGVANAAIAQAALRLDEQTVKIRQLETAIRETIEENLHLADGEDCTLIKLKRAINYTFGEYDED